MCGHNRFANTLPSNQKNLFPSHGVAGWLQASTHWGLPLKLTTQNSRKKKPNLSIYLSIYLYPLNGHIQNKQTNKQIIEQNMVTSFT